MVNMGTHILLGKSNTIETPKHYYTHLQHYYMYVSVAVYTCSAIHTLYVHVYMWNTQHTYMSIHVRTSQGFHSSVSQLLVTPVRVFYPFRDEQYYTHTIV